MSLSLSDASGSYAMMIQDVRYAPPILAALFIPRIRAWLGNFPGADCHRDHPNAKQYNRQAIEILTKAGNDEDRRFVEVEAERRIAAGDWLSDTWLPALIHLNPVAGVEVLERLLNGIEITRNGRGIELFSSVFNNDYGSGVDLAGAGFSPKLLLRLLRIAYTQVRVADDARHEGSYSPDGRDYAERARNAILSAMFAAPGPEGWEAKLEMASDPLFAHLKDRTRALAEEKVAEEADCTAFTEREVVILDRMGESAPATRDAMFALLRDRLDDLDDLLLQDVSPREAWAAIHDEHVMRRSIAWALNQAARGAYKVDQEAVTADEKETDIRMRSTVSAQQATIELKLGDNRSGRDLFDTLRNQLLKKYMAADDCRSGCLLITIAKERKWEHPVTRKMVGFDDLIRVLNHEAEDISRELGGSAKIFAKGLDLRPRLGRE